MSLSDLAVTTNSLNHSGLHSTTEVVTCTWSEQLAMTRKKYGITTVCELHVLYQCNILLLFDNLQVLSLNGIKECGVNEACVCVLCINTIIVVQLFCWNISNFCKSLCLQRMGPGEGRPTEREKSGSKNLTNYISTSTKWSIVNSERCQGITNRLLPQQ